MPLTICQYCNKEKQTRFKICIDCVVINTQEQKKLCVTCGVLQGWVNFNNDRHGMFKLDPRCKTCRGRATSSNLKIKASFLRRMLSQCRSRTTTRNANGRRNLRFTWTYDQMLRKLEKQMDRCAVSDLLMNFKTHSDWQCSPERIDNSKGYVDSNMKFICLEFQLGQSLQASREMVDFLCKIETSPHPRLEEIRSGKFKEEEWKAHCPLLQNRCKECHSSYNKFYRNTIQGRLCVLAGSATQRTKKRIELGRSNQEYKNTAEYNLKMLQDQEGKCQLTGHHLGFKTGTFACVSLNRMDVSIGYKTGNCSLILQCLNTVDRTAQTSSLPKEGSGGWTREKIEFLRNSRK